MGNLGEMIFHVQTSAPIDSDSPQDVSHADTAVGRGVPWLCSLICRYNKEGLNFIPPCCDTMSQTRPPSITRPMPAAGLQDVDHAAVVTGSGVLRLFLFVTRAYAFIDTY